MARLPAYSSTEAFVRSRRRLTSSILKLLRGLHDDRCARAISNGSRLAFGAQANEARLANIFRKACFRRFRRAFETPFNLIPEARLCLRTQRGPVQPEGTRLYIAASGLRLSARMRPPIATKQAPATRSIQ